MIPKCLRGVIPLYLRISCLSKKILKWLNEDDVGYLVEFGLNSLSNLTVNSMELSHNKDVAAVAKSNNQILQEILHNFQSVFDAPTGLPIARKQDYMIQLKERASSPHIQPYRYPYYQKNEIEMIVKEMLVVGIIMPSTTPYSSPIILVKKKDDGWHMCITYKALNKPTILDTFPIPVIDELLDELHCATFFSKLDLKFGYHQI